MSTAMRWPPRAEFLATASRFGGEHADIAFREAEASDALFDEIPILLLGELAVRPGECAELADEGIDLLLARIDAEFLFRGSQQHSAGEEVLHRLIL
jgi:hypothetical protein